MDDAQIEQEIQAKGLTAPRVTKQDIESAILSEYYFTASEGVIGAHAGEDSLPEMFLELDLLTFCVLVMKNGFTVTGTSACVSPENFDAEIGKKIARQDAFNELWSLMGYELKQRIFEQDMALTLLQAQQQS